MKAWSHTDTGKARTQNQDFYHVELFHESDYALCVVCDGMGGAKAGNVASELACTTFVEEFHMALKPTMNAKAIRSALRQAVKEANRKVFEKSRSSPDYYGMGTTLVGGLITSERAIIANVGDSRAYLADTEGIQRITHDHSVVEDLLLRGELNAEQARNHPSKNLITRALGTEEEVLCDIFTLELRPGDYILLCSDGLSNMVDDQELLYELMHSREDSDVCQRLVDIANERGGPDNITLAVLEI